MTATPLAGAGGGGGSSGGGQAAGTPRTPVSVAPSFQGALVLILFLLALAVVAGVGFAAYTGRLPFPRRGIPPRR